MTFQFGSPCDVPVMNRKGANQIQIIEYDAMVLRRQFPGLFGGVVTGRRIERMGGAVYVEQWRGVRQNYSIFVLS